MSTVKLSKSKPHCPKCRKSKFVTRHSKCRRPDGSTYSRWLCRKCRITFLRRKDKAKGNYPRKWTR
jgi:transposase-like protein